MTAPVLEDRRPSPARLAGFAVLFVAVAATLAVFSAFPWDASAPDAALLKVAFKHVAAFEHEGRQLSAEELAKLPRHMRPPGGVQAASGHRARTRVSIALDGRPLLQAVYHPSGLRRDGPTFAYEELPLPAGRHRIQARVEDGAEPARAGERDRDGRHEGEERQGPHERDQGDERDAAHGRGHRDADRPGPESARRWRLDRDVVIGPRQVLRLELTEDAGLVLR